MQPKEFVEILMRRCMAQYLEEFERQVEKPLTDLRETSSGPSAHRLGQILDGCYESKALFRKKLQAFESDCLDLIPSDLDINALELVRRSA